MGRNVNSDTIQQIVPINGAVYRNSSNNGAFVDGNGAQYIPSNGTAIMSATDYPKYVALNAASLNSRPINTSAGGLFNNGVLTATPSSVTFLAGGQYIPYMQTEQQRYYPFAGQQSKFWFTGSTATNGSVVVMAFARSGYRQSSGNTIPAYVFNTSGTLLSAPTARAAYCWYDSITGTFRIIGANDSATMQLYTSSNGINWTASNISIASVSNSLGWGLLGSSSYYHTAQVGSGQKVFITAIASSTGNSYALYASTNNGALLNDITRELNGNTNDFYNGSGRNTYLNLNYDGTTLFLPISGAWRFSTNDGASFSNSTISGVTTSIDNNAQGAIRGANASTFMYLFSAEATSNRVYVTTNGGQSFVSYNWTPAATLNTSWAIMPGGHDGNNRWCFVYQTTVGQYAATSTDNGATWTHTQVNTLTSFSQPMICAYLDDAFYIASSGGGSGIWRSTNGTNWTLLTSNVQIGGYGQPYYTLTDAVVIGNCVIRKSDQAVFRLNPNNLVSSPSGFTKNFGNYISSNLFVQAQPNDLNAAYQLISSANAFTANIFSPNVVSNQQTGQGGINPTTIEYWRIR